MKKLLSLCLSMVIVLSVSACGNPKKQLRKENFGIATSFYPVYITTLNLTSGAEGVDVVNLTEADRGCLHDYILTTEDIPLLSQADIFIASGMDMEAFVGKNSLGIPGLRVIDSGEDIPITLREKKKYNPHYWMSIKNTIAQSEKIARTLVRSDPKNEEIYVRNLEEYKEKLEGLLAEALDVCGSMESGRLVALGGTFDYLSEELGLAIAKVFSGHKAEKLSKSEIAEVTEYIKTEEIDAVVVEKGFGDMAALKKISKETGCEVVELDILTHGTPEGEEKDAYINAMRGNIGILKTISAE